MVDFGCPRFLMWFLLVSDLVSMAFQRFDFVIVLQKWLSYIWTRLAARFSYFEAANVKVVAHLRNLKEVTILKSQNVEILNDRISYHAVAVVPVS